MFFPFPQGTWDCDMVTSVVGLVWDLVGALEVTDNNAGVSEGLCSENVCF